MDASEFYDLAKSPPAELLADYPWLATALEDAPKGASLEGFLWPATYRVLPDTTPEELIRLMLDKFAANVGADRMNVAQGPRPDLLPGPHAGLDRRERGPARRGEAAHRGRLPEPARRREVAAPDLSNPTRRSSTSTTRSSSPSSSSTDWQHYLFWAPIEGGLTDETLPPELAGLQDLHSPGPAARADRHADADLDRRRARARHDRRLPVLRGQARRRAARTPSPRPSSSTRRTSRST